MSFVRSKLNLAILTILSTTVCANETEINSTANNDSIKLNTIVTNATEQQEVGKTLYTKDDLDKTPNSSKNITDFLKVNPNVQFGNNFKSGLQQGELSPAEISINGGLPYENKFLINGMSINNNINPVGATTSNSNNELLSSSQAVAVNADLICNIKLLDSNVSAEYGEFTGGVVSAETCAPKTEVGKIHGNITYDYTSDSWSKINFPDPESQQEFETSNSEKNQPFFTKQGVSATLYGNLTDQLGFNAFGSFRHSLIPLKTNFIEPAELDQTRAASNYGVELFYTPSDKTSLKIGTQLFENKGEYFNATFLNSENTQISDSQSIYINLKNKLNAVRLEQQLNYQTQKSSRKAEQDAYVWARSSTKNWNPNLSTQSYGNYGSLSQEEKKLEYSIKALFEPINFANSSHQFKMGAGYGHYEAYWERPEVSNNYYTTTIASKNIENLNCYASDGRRYDACDEGNSIDGQYLTQRFKYDAGQINVRQDRWHAYLEDSIYVNPFIQSSLGLRADYDSLTQNTNIAPRSSFVLKPFGNDQLFITAGWNRYYGLNAFANELQDQRGRLQTKFKRNSLSEGWELDPTYMPSFKSRSELDTPFSDETVFAFNTNIWNINTVLKYVQRENKDQLRQQQGNKSYNNSGKSEADILTFSLKNIKPIVFKNSMHHLSLNADMTDTNRNFDSYESNYYTGTSQIYYDGKLINAEDKPTDNFNTPWTVRLDWNIGFNNIPLNINHYLSYRAGTSGMKKTLSTSKTEFVYELDGMKYDTYTAYKTKNALNWDMRTTYTIPSSKNTQTIFGLTINNVLNRKNEYFSSNTSSVTPTPSPEIGRQFIADVTFKF